MRPSSSEDARRGSKNIKNSMIESVQKPTTGTHCTDIGQVALLAVTKKTISHTGPYLLSSSKPANRPQHANGSKGQSGEKIDLNPITRKIMKGTFLHRAPCFNGPIAQPRKLSTWQQREQRIPKSKAWQNV